MGRESDGKMRLELLSNQDGVHDYLTERKMALVGKAIVLQWTGIGWWWKVVVGDRESKKLNIGIFYSFKTDDF